MYIYKIYNTRSMVMWTRFETLKFIIIITVWLAAYYWLPIDWLQIPWTPVALIGTAVAFVIGFQNNAVYSRIWEARKIWGGVVNTSRTFGMFIQDMVTNEYCKEDVSEGEIKKEVRQLTYRHVAWLTALRHAMREKRPWETTYMHVTNYEWGIEPPERSTTLEEDLKPYLSEEDLTHILAKGNKQTALLYLQSHHLRSLKEKGLVWEFSFLQLESVLEEMFTLQGKSERIKNFPYPRQYATLNHFFMWILLLILPMALIPQFMEIGHTIAASNSVIGDLFIWLALPVYLAVAWVFHTMERIGRTGENPFEGTANDVPISTIARGIEIDLRQNLGETDEIPAAYPDQMGVQY